MSMRRRGAALAGGTAKAPPISVFSEPAGQTPIHPRTLQKPKPTGQTPIHLRTPGKNAKNAAPAPRFAGPAPTATT